MFEVILGSILLTFLALIIGLIIIYIKLLKRYKKVVLTVTFILLTILSLIFFYKYIKNQQELSHFNQFTNELKNEFEYIEGIKLDRFLTRDRVYVYLLPEYINLDNYDEAFVFIITEILDEQNLEYYNQLFQRDGYRPNYYRKELSIIFTEEWSEENPKPYKFTYHSNDESNYENWGMQVGMKKSTWITLDELLEAYK